MELQDFHDMASGAISKADFQNQSSNQLKVGGATASNLAAQEAIMYSDGSAESYRQLRQELLDEGTRRNYLERRDERRRQDLQQLNQHAPEILLDPNLDDVEKVGFLSGIKEASSTYKESSMDRVLENSIITPDPKETDDAYEAKLNLSDIVGEVNEHKRRQQALINATEMAKDQGVLDKILDLGELMAPFAEWIHVDKLNRELIGEGNAILPGQQKQQIYEYTRSLPLEKRAEITEQIIALVEDHENVVLPDGNDLASLETLHRMMIDNDYSNAERWFDNVVPILDAIGVGELVRLAKGGVKAITTSEKATSVAKSVATDVKPTSVSQVVKEGSPDRARAIHRAIDQDPTDEAATALSGTNRDEALAKDLLPEPDVADGKVPNKVSMDGPRPEPEDVKTLRNRDARSEITEAEEARVITKVKEDLEDIAGIREHPESMKIRANEDGTTKFSLMYRPKDSGWKTAAAALENAKFAYRSYGLNEENLTLYMRVRDEWVPTTQKELAARKELRDQYSKRRKKIPAELKEIDYAVGIDYDYRFAPEDLQIEGLLSIKRNWADLFKPWVANLGQGSVTQHVVDYSSSIHPRIVEPAYAKTDKAVALKKAYVDLFADFTKKYSGISKDRREYVADYIHEANAKGIKFDITDLKARGFNDKEIEALDSWRTGNDAMWYAANDDLVVTLRGKGYNMFVDSNSNTNLIAKPVKRGAVTQNTDIYRSDLNAIVNITKDDLDNFYSGGGTVAKLKSPIEVNGDYVEYIHVPNKSGAGYLRKIRDNETVLAYREGYYPVMYDANFFIKKFVKTKNGDEIEVTIASAKTKADAEKYVTDMTQNNTDPNVRFVNEEDKTSKAERAKRLSEKAFDVASAAGLSSQRHRGAGLKDATAGAAIDSRQHLRDPLDAVASQVAVLSERASLRRYLETTKRRWMQSYGDQLELPKDFNGNDLFPAKVSDITGKMGANKKMVADARTLFNNINHLENGYANSVDATYKAMMNSTADLISGDAKFKKSLEGWMRDSSKGSPTSAAKGAVFKMFLAANPARQILVQSHQTVQLLAINPTYTLKGMPEDLFRIGRVMRGYKGDPEAAKMWEELRLSGMLDAVDENNLVRNDVQKLADISLGQKIRGAAATPLNVAQKIGFDKGEQMVLVSSWLAHRDMAIKAGKALTPRTYEEIAGKARAFTYAMNKAGDMPYNTNSLAVVAQFLQVPHKALLQPLTNRSLTRTQRGQLLAFNTIMYGIPVGTMSFLYDHMKEGPVRDTLEHGLEDVLLNGIFTTFTGEQQQLDWGDFAPSDITGMGEFVTALATLNIGQMISNAPATSLFFGGNPRLTNAAKTAARYFHLTDDYDDPELDTKFTDVAIAFGNLFSGFSNGAKARYAWESRKKVSSLGNLTDEDITKFEAFMQFFGIQTKTESGRRRVNEIRYGNSWGDADESDMEIWYRELKSHLTRRGQSLQEREIQQRVLSEAWRAFGAKEMKARESLFRRIQNDVKENDFTIFKEIQTQMGVMTNSEVREMINSMPDSKNRDLMNQTLDNYEKVMEEDG